MTADKNYLTELLLLDLHLHKQLLFADHQSEEAQRRLDLDQVFSTPWHVDSHSIHIILFESSELTQPTRFKSKALSLEGSPKLWRDAPVPDLVPMTRSEGPSMKHTANEALAMECHGMRGRSQHLQLLKMRLKKKETNLMKLECFIVLMQGLCSDTRVWSSVYRYVYHIISMIIDTLYTYPTGLQGFKLQNMLFFRTERLGTLTKIYRGRSWCNQCRKLSSNELTEQRFSKRM